MAIGHSEVDYLLLATVVLVLELPDSEWMHQAGMAVRSLAVKLAIINLDLVKVEEDIRHVLVL
jgi:hypothetical protein